MLKNSFVNIHFKHMAKSRIRKLYSVLLTSCNESTLSLSVLETLNSKGRGSQTCLNMLMLNNMDIL